MKHMGLDSQPTMTLGHPGSIQEWMFSGNVAVLWGQWCNFHKLFKRREKTLRWQMLFCFCGLIDQSLAQLQKITFFKNFWQKRLNLWLKTQTEHYETWCSKSCWRKRLEIILYSWVLFLLERYICVARNVRHSAKRDGVKLMRLPKITAKLNCYPSLCLK